MGYYTVFGGESSIGGFYITVPVWEICELNCYSGLFEKSRRVYIDIGADKIDLIIYSLYKGFQGFCLYCKFKPLLQNLAVFG